MDPHDNQPPPQSPPPSPHPFASLRSMESFESSSSDEEQRPVLPLKTPHSEAIYKRYQKQGRVGSVIRQEDAEQQREEAAERQVCVVRFRMKNLDTGEQQQIVSEQQEMVVSKRLSIGRQEITTNGLSSWHEFWTNVYHNNDQLKTYCEEGLYDEASHLLANGQNGYPVEVDCRGLDEWTPLHFACYQGHADVVGLLCKQGAAVNAVTRYNRNGLHLAALRGHYEVARTLADCGIMLDAYDSDGNTALHFAAENGHREIIVFLLEKGCKVSKNREGATPITDCCQDYLKRLFFEHGYREDGQYHMHGVPLPAAANRLHRQILDSQGLSLQSFEYLRVLGRGSFGEVFLVRRKGEERLLAMKVLQKARLSTNNLRRYAMTERNVMSALDHPFMVRLAYAFQSPSRLFLVMDYYSGGDLGKAITRRKCFNEEEARLYVCQVVLALEALHKNMIVFRDLKPDNVVLDAEGHCRLADFGLSKEGIYNNITQSFCGSIAYLAPEVLSKQGHSRTVDWYLLGVLMYELIVGIPPYYNTKKEVLFDNIKRGPLKLPKALSFDAKDLIKRLLCRDPKKRLGAIRDSEQIKEHPYFKDVNWEEVLARRVPMPPPEQSPELGANESIRVTFEEEDSHGKVEGWTFIQQKQ